MIDKEYILCSAIWYKDLPLIRPEVLEPRGFRPYNVDKGVVISGWRHGNCIYQIMDTSNNKYMETKNNTALPDKVLYLIRGVP